MTSDGLSDDDESLVFDNLDDVDLVDGETPEPPPVSSVSATSTTDINSAPPNINSQANFYTCVPLQIEERKFEQNKGTVLTKVPFQIEQVLFQWYRIVTSSVTSCDFGKNN